MGILRDQRMRLLREEGWTGDALAEELYSMFSSEGPVEFDSPINITNTTGGSGLTINQGGTGDQAVTINRTEAPYPPIPGLPPIDIPPAGNTYLTVIYADGTTKTYDPKPKTTPKKDEGENKNKGGGGGGTPAKVVSGTGTTYLVTLYPDGPAGAPGDAVTATQLQIEASEQIKPDNWTIVNKSGDFYYMQFPVWGDDIP